MHKDSVYAREILRAIARGEGYLSPEVSGAVLNDYRRHVTDPIDLNLSVYTVDAHRGRIILNPAVRDLESPERRLSAATFNCSADLPSG